MVERILGGLGIVNERVKPTVNSPYVLEIGNIWCGRLSDENEAYATIYVYKSSKGGFLDAIENIKGELEFITTEPYQGLDGTSRDQKEDILEDIDSKIKSHFIVNKKGKNLKSTIDLTYFVTGLNSSLGKKVVD
ncbi:MAG: hypothetical protein PHE43_01545 [Candidatus Nanoarchaeia archaeon]|nr:hypothetical protein [Candidatus Nanoarchaeia archaeon]